MKMDLEKIIEVTKEKHKDYLENDEVSPAQMILHMEQHQAGKCFPTCFFCKVDKTAIAELLRQQS